MGKTRHYIDIGHHKDLHIKEAFEYFATRCYRKLKFNNICHGKYDNTYCHHHDRMSEQCLIENTYRINNVNAYKMKGYVSESEGISNIVGYIENVQVEGDILSFDLNYMKTIKGKKYIECESVGFDITFTDRTLKLTTDGSYVPGALLETDDKSVHIIKFLISNTGKNKISIHRSENKMNI